MPALHRAALCGQHTPCASTPPLRFQPLHRASGNLRLTHPPRTPASLPQDGYLAFSRACLRSQESTIFVPAAGVLAAAGAAPLQAYVSPPRPAGGPPPLYELRQYQVRGGPGAGAGVGPSQGGARVLGGRAGPSGPLRPAPSILAPT